MKAMNLMRLREAGLPVPAFRVIEADEQIGQRETLDLSFSEAAFFAVRSSYAEEDGEKHSYAGQFTSLLSVPRDQVAEAIAKVRQSRYSAAVMAYRQSCLEDGREAPSEPLQAKSDGGYIDNEHIDGGYIDSGYIDNGFRVIVQEMVEAEFSGVIFTANPKGLLSEMVVVAAPGLGEAVVSDAVDTVSLHIHRTEGSRYRVLSGEEIALPAQLIEAAVALAGQVEALFGRPMDIEYAYRDGQMFLLQARPISSLSQQAKQVILDDSNIAESYPGLSLPLTVSFAEQIYSGVFQSLLVRLIGERAVEKQYRKILAHMVEGCNGRLYYRITNWYEILHLLPFSSKIIPLWQEMLGVENKAVSFALGRVPLRRKLRVVAAFVRLLTSVRRRMKRLDERFMQLLPVYERRIAAEEDAKKLWQLYRELFERLVADWDWTLINDMYAFLFTGLAGKHRDRISRIKELESMKPVREMEKLVQTALQEGIDSERYMAAEAAYIDRYGDRCVGELKLETKTYRSHPTLLREQILAQCEQTKARREQTEAQRRQTEAQGRQTERRNISAGEPANEEETNTIRRGRLPLFARLAQYGIEGRERSRMNRSRIFGIMRTIMRKIADSPQCQLGEDIFYLRLEEIEGLLFSGQDMREQIEIAKLRQASFAKIPPFNRLIFAGEPFEIAEGIAEATEEVMPSEHGVGAAVQPEHGSEATAGLTSAGLLQGAAVSAGVVRGRLLLVKDPQTIDPAAAAGRILVTHSTDPGWFMLVHRCRGLIAEKGSLLSHTAIIARELKKPAVVGIRQALQRLRDGEYVELDADRGLIRRLDTDDINGL
ncbi:MAG: PEP/pyruvate-binding domain-containing protein [Eubacteriales bacterium]|nr:PEP/pyruvate-binding domain-containing protein [Eubacteriales bacterium]